MGAISYQCLQGHKHATLNVYKDTSMQLSIPNQWAQSSTHSFRTRTRLLSCNNLGGVSISTNVFEFSMLQVKVNRRNSTSLSISHN